MHTACRAVCFDRDHSFSRSFHVEAVSRWNGVGKEIAVPVADFTIHNEL